MPTAAFITWARQPDKKKVLAVIAQPKLISTGTALPVYIADVAGYHDGEHYYKGGIPEGSTFTIEYGAKIMASGRSSPAFGPISLAIKPAEVVRPGVTWRDLLCGTYAWKGHPVAIHIGGPALAWANWRTFTGYMGHPTSNETVDREGRVSRTSSLPIFTKAELIYKIKIPPHQYEAA